jgi:hypothetical protein
MVIILGLSSNSCEELILEEEPAQDAQTNFDFLWQEAKEKYAFFDYKGIDWDEVYREYNPRIQEDTRQIELFNVLFEMLNELRDGHVNLYSAFNQARYDIRLLGPENIDFRLIKENYLGEDFYITGPFAHDFLAEGEVAYVRYSSFSNAVSNFDMDFLFLRYQETKGMIIDLRQNGGGSLTNMYTILNRFAQEKTLIYNSFIKTGPGTDEFSEAQPAYLEPVDEDRLQYDKPVIVLTDRGTYSAASFFALATKALPNFRLLGDTTGGGLGIPNGGQLPNGWTYRFSISQTISPDGENYENGVPVDEQVIFGPVNQIQGVDPVIDRAVEILRR